MRTIRPSTVGMLIALVSTAALGPGTFFPAELHAADQRQPRMVAQPVEAPEALQAVMQIALGTSAEDGHITLLADEALQDGDFSLVDFSWPAGSAPLRAPSGQGRDAGWGGYPGSAAGLGYEAAVSAAQAGPGLQTQWLSTSLPDLRIIWGQAGADGEMPSAIALDEPADVHRSIGQLPASALAPGELDSAGRADINPASGGTAVPEPATMLLIGFGLLSLVAAQRKRS